MLDYLLTATLLIVTFTQLLLVWACHDFRQYRGEFSEWMRGEAHTIGQGLTEYGAILEDIASALESGSGGGVASLPIQGPGGGIAEILSNALISRIALASEHGESETHPVRAVHEAEQPTPEE
jgi:hypothetical protein